MRRVRYDVFMVIEMVRSEAALPSDGMNLLQTYGGYEQKLQKSDYLRNLRKKGESLVNHSTN